MAEQDCCGTVILRGPKGDQGEPGPAAETNVEVKDPITADGSGTEGDPYVIGLGLSADYGNNNLSIGSDGGLYSPIPDGSETIVTAGTGNEVTGVGTVDDPYIVTSTVTAADLGAVTSVTGTGGVTATADGTDVTVSADISAAEGNQLVLDADGLYVSAQTSIGDNTYVLGEGLVQSGTGTAEDPYVLSVSISADAGNSLTYGTDGGLYVPDTSSAEIGDWIDLDYDTANWTALRAPQYRLIGDKQAAIRFQLIPNAGFEINNSQPVTLPAEAVPAVSTYTAGSCSGSATTGGGTVAPALVRFDIHSAADDGKITIVDLRGITNWVAVDAIYWLD